ncbi:hypothetical protein N7466_005695 [Penicillium verhagenii]|uniref:uncharacterized protein n=1 Tax=Penicillium verhagenii TaxID=1562060 RepID=UPI0025453C5E|nr:uncharacterized protein N7466_005695 [Penicillium verhagenii]KAJ5930202.1 hypothetical protein N7466_005695 [Penicillium verhagenii]
MVAESGLKGRELLVSFENGSLTSVIYAYVKEYNIVRNFTKARVYSSTGVSLMAHEILYQQRVPDIDFTPVLNGIVGDADIFCPSKHETLWL